MGMSHSQDKCKQKSAKLLHVVIYAGKGSKLIICSASLLICLFLKCQIKLCNVTKISLLTLFLKHLTFCVHCNASFSVLFLQRIEEKGETGNSFNTDPIPCNYLHPLK